jgi:predicted porin
MKKKLISLCIGVAVSSPGVLMAQTVLYGKAHVAVESETALDKAGKDDGNALQIKSYGSRVGIKGSEDIGNGLQGLFQFEWQFDIADAGKVGVNVDADNDFKAKASNHIVARNQFVGLSGGFGTVLLGRHDTPLKMSQGKFDLFNDIYADIKKHFAGETRANNVLAYLTPKFGDFQIVSAYVPSENKDNDKILSIAGIYDSDSFYGALAYNSYDESFGVGDSLLRATGTYKFGNFGIGGLYQQAKPTTGDSTDAMGVNFFVKSGANKFKIQYQQGDGQNVGVKTAKLKEDASTISLGVDHGFSKRTSSYLAVHQTSHDNADKDDIMNIGIGIIHKF